VSGRPAHSFEVLVLGGSEADIVQSIFDNKAAGIETYGSSSAVVVDSQGNNHTINYSRPSSITIWLNVTLTVDVDYPTDGDAQVEAAILAYGAALDVGDDVVVFPYLVGAIVGIPGITDVVIDIGTSDPPSGDANIAITETEIAVFDSGRITVAS
jgi:hypothetical protein